MEQTTKVETIEVQSRWRSSIMWYSVTANLLSLGELTGFWNWAGIDLGTAGKVVAVILLLLTNIGYLNNPSNKKF